jgi:hypothetical protein
MYLMTVFEENRIENGWRLKGVRGKVCVSRRVRGHFSVR